jgi:hypothetical protein
MASLKISQVDTNVIFLKKIYKQDALDGPLLVSMIPAIQNVAQTLGLDKQGFYVRTNAASEGATPHMHGHALGPGIP